MTSKEWILLIGLLMTMLGISWKWKGYYILKNIVVISLFVAAFILGKKDIDAQQAKDNKIVRTEDSINKHQSAVDSILLKNAEKTLIHRNDSLEAIVWEISQEGNKNGIIANTGKNNGVQIGTNNGFLPIQQGGTGNTQTNIYNPSNERHVTKDFLKQLNDINPDNKPIAFVIMLIQILNVSTLQKKLLMH